MHIITELYKIDHCRTTLTENFKNNKRKWEVVDIESEYAEIKDGYYHLKNKSTHRWNYYKVKTRLNKNQDFLIESTIELANQKEVYGHVGLVWGFNQKHEYLNRFTLSADGKRALIIHFEKDHKTVFHRYQNKNLPKINISQPIQFTIIKLGAYFHFFINQQRIYIGHECLFANYGNYIGYYLEPGLSVKTNFLQVKSIKSHSLKVTTGLEQLMNDA